MEKNATIFLAGHQGMVGSSILRTLKKSGYSRIITVSRRELDLLDQTEVRGFLAAHRPDYIIVAAAKVGGIQANNTFPADFIYENLQIQCNLIQGAHAADVGRLLFLGSSCIYPKYSPQPMMEEYLLSGPLEQTNAAYALAKIAGIKLCESFNRQYGRAYVSVMPTNLYGPNDNYDLHGSHVLPALVRKAHDAVRQRKGELEVWGTGQPLREFLYVDDLAEACVLLMEREDIVDGIFNVGSGIEISIRELAAIVASIVGFSGKLVFDHDKPDGVARKLLDSTRISELGWVPKVDLATGIARSYEAFLKRFE